MSDWPLLSLVIFLPLAGAAFILLIRGEPEVVAQNARSVALWTASITFLLSLLIWGNFDPAAPTSSWSRRSSGSPASTSTTTSASTASRCSSCCSAP